MNETGPSILVRDRSAPSHKLNMESTALRFILAQHALSH